MKTKTPALLIVTIMTTTIMAEALHAWPQVPYTVTKFTERDVLSKGLSKYDGPPVVDTEVGPDGHGGVEYKASMDLLALRDAWKSKSKGEPAPSGGAGFWPFMGDCLCLAAEGVLIGAGAKYGYGALDRYVINRDKYKSKDETPQTMPIDKGSIFLGNGTEVGGDVNSLGAPIKTGENVVIKGSVNTGPMAPEGGE